LIENIKRTIKTYLSVPPRWNSLNTARGAECPGKKGTGNRAVFIPACIFAKLAVRFFPKSSKRGGIIL
jgi:hypothetical protein